MDGRAEMAMDTARRLAKRAADGKSVYAAYRRSLPLLTLLRLQRWSDVLAEPVPSTGGNFEIAIYEYARAVSLARTGHLAQAREAGAASQKTLSDLQLQAPAVGR